MENTTNQKERGQLICNDLAWYGFKAEWFIDPFNELFLIVDNKLMKCMGEIEYNGKKYPYWVAVRPTYRSLMMRQISGKKIEYTPLFD